jgi:hypothetical protein
MFILDNDDLLQQKSSCLINLLFSLNETQNSTLKKAMALDDSFSDLSGACFIDLYTSSLSAYMYANGNDESEYLVKPKTEFQRYIRLSRQGNDIALLICDKK